LIANLAEDAVFEKRKATRMKKTRFLILFKLRFPGVGVKKRTFKVTNGGQNKMHASETSNACFGSAFVHPSRLLTRR